MAVLRHATWLGITLGLACAAPECDLNSEPCEAAVKSSGFALLQTQKRQTHSRNNKSQKTTLTMYCEGVTDEIVAEIDAKYDGAQCEEGKLFYMSKFAGMPSNWCNCESSRRRSEADLCKQFTNEGRGERRRRRACTGRRRRSVPSASTEEPCLAPSVKVMLASDHTSKIMKDISEGDTLKVINFNVSTMSYSESSVAKVLGWSHKLGHSNTPIDFVEIVVDGSKKLRISKEHYIVSRSESNSSPSVKLVANIIPSNLLPMWDEDRSTVHWQEIVQVYDVTEFGFYTPLLSTSGQLVTSDGFIVPLLAELTNESVRSSLSNPEEFVTPEEVDKVYNAWIGHWAEIALTYPCLEKFDSTFHEVEGVKVFERFFQNHPHDVDDATNTSKFLEQLRSDPEDLVGVEMAHHLRAFCSELYVDAR